MFNVNSRLPPPSIHLRAILLSVPLISFRQPLVLSSHPLSMISLSLSLLVYLSPPSLSVSLHPSNSPRSTLSLSLSEHTRTRTRLRGHVGVQPAHDVYVRTYVHTHIGIYRCNAHEERRERGTAATVARVWSPWSHGGYRDDSAAYTPQRSALVPCVLPR